MKVTNVSTVFALALSCSATSFHGSNSPHAWEPAGEDDFRGPCPMMNTMANHGFLPRNGRDITKEVAVSALSSALNFDTLLAEIMFDAAIIANPEPNATFFTLDHLNRHNVLEHDASLSRSDDFFGNNHIFNETIFEETRAYWTEPILDGKMLANSKLARQITSRAFNPNYTFTAKTEQFSLGELAAPIIVFGDMDAGTVNRTLVEYFFENERLPEYLGWTKPANVVMLADISRMAQLIANSTNLMTDSEPARLAARQDLHSGLLAP